MRHLILRHEILRRVPKTAVIVFALSGLVVNVALFFSGPTSAQEWLSRVALAVLQAFVYLSATILLWLPEGGRRCRTWELSLPVPGRKLWQGHYFSMLLAGILVMLVYAPLPVMVYIIDRGMDMSPFFQHQVTSLPDLLLDLWGLPLLFWILTLDIVALWWPGSAWPGSHPRWRLRLLVLLPAMAGGLVLISLFMPAPFFLVILAVMGIWHGRVKIPGALTVPDSGDSQQEAGAWEGSAVPSGSSWVVHRTILRTLFKWPAHWLLMIPMGGFFGMVLGGYNLMTSDPGALRFNHVFLSAYLLLAGAGYFLENLHKVDHLPISRRTLLAWLVVPLVGLMLIGYGLGSLLAGEGAVRREGLAFVDEQENYGLKVPPRLFRLSAGPDSPDIEAPWGETHPADSVPVLKGLPWVFYKPYSTPEGCSLEFVHWQLSRALEEYYGVIRSPQEIATASLFAQGDDRVLLRADALDLAPLNPGWDAKPMGPVFPWIMGAVFGVFLLCLWIIFRALRSGGSLKKQRILFWGLMAFLLVLHLGGFALFMAHLTDDWILDGVIYGFLSRPQSLSPAFRALSHAGLLVVLAGGWLTCLAQFRRMEAARS